MSLSVLTSNVRQVCVCVREKTLSVSPAVTPRLSLYRVQLLFHSQRINRCDGLATEATPETHDQPTALPIQTHFDLSLPVITCFPAPLWPPTLLHTLPPAPLSSGAHPGVEPLTFECVFVELAAHCIRLSEDGR